MISLSDSEKSDGFIRFDATGIIAETVGLGAAHEAAVIGDSFFDIWDFPSPDELRKQVAERSAVEPAVFLRLSPRGSSDSELWKVVCEFDALGDMTGCTAYENSELQKEFFSDFAAGSSEKYFALFDNTFVGIGVMKDNVFVAANKRLLNIFGFYSLDDFVTKSLWDHIHPENRKEIRDKMISASLDGKKEFTIEVPVVRKDGEHRDLELMFGHIHAAGESYIQIIARDVTLHKQAYKALHRSEALFRAFVETTHYPLFILDRDGRYLYVSANCEKITGYSPGEIIGQRKWFTTDDGRIKLQKAFQRCIDDRMAVNGLHIMFKAKNCSYISMFVSFSPVFEQDGTIRAVLMQTADSVQYGEQGSERMEIIGRMAGRMAHDFNNLLQIMIAHINFIQYSLDEENPVQKNVNIISKVCARATTLTRQLLAFSKKRILKREHIDMNALLESNKEMFRQITGDNVLFRLDTSDKISPVYGDPAQIEEALFNLAINAREAMTGQGHLNVAAADWLVNAEHCERYPQARPGLYVMVEFADDGAGIEAENIGRVFEPFYSTKKNGEGIGMGLSVVYGVATQHGGWVEVESERGVGSSFRVYFPVKPSAVSAEPAVRTRTDRDLTGVNVLYVEDDEDVRCMTESALKERGLTVFSAESAEKALEIYESAGGKVDIVFSDVILPGMSGFEFSELIKGRDERVGILLCSGYADERSQGALIEKKGYAFLQKPYVLIDILNAFGELMSGQ